MAIILGDKNLTLEDFIKVVRIKEKVVISEQAKLRILAANKSIKKHSFKI